MIDDTRDFVTDNEEVPLPSPHDLTSAPARTRSPVKPLPTSRPASRMQRARDFQRKVGVKTKTLALVMVAGLAIGAASGAMLANRNQSSSLTPVIEQSNDETAATEDTIKETASTGETISALTAVMATPRSAHIRRHSPAPRRRTQPRAYRVAVLK